MGTFITTPSSTVPGPKVDAQALPGTADPDQWVAAADYNAVADALYDIRTHVIGAFYNVKAFGAVGDGVANDTTAIQAAITAATTAGGGTVYVPWGSYKVTSTLTMGNHVRLVGAASGHQGVTNKGSVLNASTMTTGGVVNMTGTNNQIRSLRLVGPGAPGVGTSVSGMYCDSGTKLVVSDVTTTGFYIACHYAGANESRIEHCHFDLANYLACGIYGCAQILLFDNVFANSGTSGDGSNLLIYGGSAQVIVLNTLIDETVNLATVRILGADRVQIIGTRIFEAHNGYGVRLGNGTTNPTNCTLLNVRVEPFSTAVPTYAIQLYGSGHTLINVTTNPNGGGDIDDNATGTTFLNVNGAYKLSSLPSASPGAGSKQIWYDPADSNRVKFAP